MTKLALTLSLTADYGHDVTTAAGARRHLRSVHGATARRLERITSDTDYSRIVRRLHSRRVVDHPLGSPTSRDDGSPSSASYVDGRLLAAGWNLTAPTRWARELESWLEYWAQAAPNPSPVGSSYNPLDPSLVAVARRIGVPAWILRGATGEGYGGGWHLIRCLRLPERLAQIASPDLSTRRLGTARVPRRLVTRLARAARAMARTSAGLTIRRPAPRREGGGVREARIMRPLCNAAWAALGRVSPETQRAILEHLADHPPEGMGPLRVRDLPWAAGARCARDCAHSPVARAAWATGKRRASLAAALTEQDRARLASPIGVLLARGLSPVDAVDRYARTLEHYDAEGPRLTAREARDFASFAEPGYAPCPARWLVRQVPASTHDAHDVSISSVPRGDIGVARWVCAVLVHEPRRESLTRLREVRHPHTGEVFRARLSSRVDELRWRDVVAAGGLRAGVDAVFEAAARRLATVATSGWATDERQICSAPRWLAPVPGVTILTTPALIVEEGRALHHCVGTYVPAVARGDSLIIAVRTPDGQRSTAEISRGALVRQHRGPENGDPPESHRQLLAHAIAPL